MKEIKNFLDLIPIIKFYPLWAQITIFIGVLIILSILFFAPRKTPPTAEKEISKVNIEKIDKVGDIVAGDKITMPSPKEDDQNNSEKKQTITKIKTNRLLDDSKLSIEKLRQEYYKESSRISSNMSGRGIGRSGMHIKAQKDHAIETKNKINESLTKLTRDIEDVLLENYDSHILKEVPELKKEYDTYISLQERIKDLYKKMVNNVQSWEVKINGSVNITKDFTLE